MLVNGENSGNVTSQGDMEQLSVGNEIFIGGYMDEQLPAQGMNLTLCQFINFNS